MRRWIFRLACAVVLGGTLPAVVSAEAPVSDGYRAATPYNATVVSRPLPNPAWNMPCFVLDCELPNQNLDTYVPAEDCCGGGCGRGGLFGGCGGDSGCNGGCNSGCGNGCGSIFDGLFNRGCNSGCNHGCGTTSCNSGCGTTSCRPTCNTGCGTTSCRPTCNTGCDAGCTIRDRFNRNFSFGCKSDCNSCDNGCRTHRHSSCQTHCHSYTTSCQSSCNSCRSGGGFFDRFSFGCHSNCDSCNSGCDRGHGFWQRWSVGCNSGCNSGCNTGCNTGCGIGCGTIVPSTQPLPPVQPKPTTSGEAKPLSYIEPIGFWNWHQEKKERANERVNGCTSCSPAGPPPKHVLPRPTTLACTGCSTWNSEGVFLFGTCRQFFGEPTWGWLHGCNATQE